MPSARLPDVETMASATAALSSADADAAAYLLARTRRLLEQLGIQVTDEALATWAEATSRLATPAIRNAVRRWLNSPRRTPPTPAEFVDLARGATPWPPSAESRARGTAVVRELRRALLEDLSS